MIRINYFINCILSKHITLKGFVEHWMKRCSCAIIITELPFFFFLSEFPSEDRCQMETALGNEIVCLSTEHVQHGHQQCSLSHAVALLFSSLPLQWLSTGVGRQFTVQALPKLQVFSCEYAVVPIKLHFHWLFWHGKCWSPVQSE